MKMKSNSPKKDLLFFIYFFAIEHLIQTCDHMAKICLIIILRNERQKA